MSNSVIGEGILQPSESEHVDFELNLRLLIKGKEIQRFFTD